jgi:hypothetical protein
MIITGVQSTVDPNERVRDAGTVTRDLSRVLVVKGPAPGTAGPVGVVQQGEGGVGDRDTAVKLWRCGSCTMAAPDSASTCRRSEAASPGRARAQVVAPEPTTSPVAAWSNKCRAASLPRPSGRR